MDRFREIAAGKSGICELLMALTVSGTQFFEAPSNHAISNQKKRHNGLVYEPGTQEQNIQYGVTQNAEYPTYPN